MASCWRETVVSCHVCVCCFFFCTRVYDREAFSRSGCCYTGSTIPSLFILSQVLYAILYIRSNRQISLLALVSYYLLPLAFYLAQGSALPQLAGSWDLAFSGSRSSFSAAGVETANKYRLRPDSTPIMLLILCKDVIRSSLRFCWTFAFHPRACMSCYILVPCARAISRFARLVMEWKRFLDPAVKPAGFRECFCAGFARMFVHVLRVSL